MNIEVLNERISAGGYGFIVGDESSVIERVQINPFHHRARHVYVYRCSE